jgi:hypothetical protein
MAHRLQTPQPTVTPLASLGILPIGGLYFGVYNEVRDPPRGLQSSHILFLIPRYFYFLLYRFAEYMKGSMQPSKKDGRRCDRTGVKMVFTLQLHINLTHKMCMLPPLPQCIEYNLHFVEETHPARPLLEA